jgi:hypothetical protein
MNLHRKECMCSTDTLLQNRGICELPRHVHMLFRMLQQNEHPAKTDQSPEMQAGLRTYEARDG